MAAPERLAERFPNNVLQLQPCEALQDQVSAPNNAKPILKVHRRKTQTMSLNIRPVMWKPKPKDEWSRQYHEDSAERRAILMEEFPEFFEMCVELAEAEAHYRTIKNLKKKDPSRFYEGRDWLFRARHAVAGFAMWNLTAYQRSEELRLVQYKRRETA
jgi:hypothetical protein